MSVNIYVLRSGPVCFRTLSLRKCALRFCVCPCMYVYVVVPAHPVAECYLVCYCASLAAIETLW